jgi:hypothetical protein
MTKILVAFAITAILGAFNAANAEVLTFEGWGASGATCAPGDPAIQANRYTITAGSVHFNSGSNGLVTLYCPFHSTTLGFFTVTTPPGVQFGPVFPNRLRFTYRDSDGTGSAVNVSVQLIRMSKDDGTIVGVPGAQLSSSSFTATGQTSRMTAFTHDFDFENNYYYVRVDMNRAAGSSAIASFFGVTLQHQ